MKIISPLYRLRAFNLASQAASDRANLGLRFDPTHGKFET